MNHQIGKLGRGEQGGKRKLQYKHCELFIVKLRPCLPPYIDIDPISIGGQGVSSLNKLSGSLDRLPTRYYHTCKDVASRFCIFHTYSYES